MMFNLSLILSMLLCAPYAYGAAFVLPGGGLKLDLSSVATAAATTTLTSVSNQIQRLTGSTTQNIVLPAATGLKIGYWFKIRNDSSGVVTVKDGGANVLSTVAATNTLTLYLADASTTNGVWSLETSSATGSGGTVTSVALSDASTSPIFVISGSPVTTSGTLTETLATQLANKVFAGPTTGAAVQPTFRALVGADLPNPSSSTLGGIQSLVAVTSKWINAISTSGVPAATQPAFTDISGAALNAQMPTYTNHTVILGTGAAGFGNVGVGSSNTVLHGNTSADPTFSAVSLTADVTGVLPNSNTTATSANTASAIVARDASGNFSAGTITAALTGNASTSTALAANPTDCGAGTKAISIDAGGNLTCSAVDLTADVSTTVLPLANGGTNNSAAASAGAVVFSDSTKLSKTAVGNSGQALLSAGTGTPIWSTPTYPSASGSAGKVLRADGTNNVYSTFTIPDTAVTSDLLYASATNVWSSLAKTNTSALITNSTGVPAWTSGGTANRLLRTDGTTVSFGQAVLTTDVTGVLPNANTTATSANTASAIVARDASNNFSAGTITAALTGNSSTSTALAANPSDCAANTYATTIAASGDLTCASITNASTTGVSTATASTLVLRDASTNFAAGTITAALTGNASTATALAANPADCGVGTKAITIAANGDLTCSAVSMTADISGVTPIANGGSNKNITLATGGILWTDADSFEVSAAGSTGQVLQSNGAAAPTWSTPTFPSASGTSGKVLRSNGTNNVYSTFTIPDTAVTSDLLYASATNVWSSLAKSNTSALVSNSSGIPSWASGSTANRLLRTDGTTVSFGQAVLTTDVSGVLPIANGGSAKALTLAAGSVVWDDADSFEVSAVGTAGQALVSGGAATPTWFAPTAGSVLFAGTSGILAQDNAAFFYDSSGDSLIVGATATTSSAPLRATKTFTDPASAIAGAAFNPTITATSADNANQVLGMVISPTIAAGNNKNWTGTVGNAFQGIRVLPTITAGATGTISELDGQFGQLSNPSAMNITTYIGSSVRDPSNTGGGTITGVAGFVTANMTAGTNNTNILLGTAAVPSGNFSIYSSSSYDSSIAGNVGIGLTTPLAMLDVSAPAAVVGTNEPIQLRSDRQAIIAGELIGGISARSNDTSNAAPGIIVTLMDSVAEATHTASVLDTAIVFQTTVDTTMAEAMRIAGNGHIEYTGTTPAVTAGAGNCGTSPVIVGNDNVGRVTVGSSTNGGFCTITFAKAWTNAPICISGDETTGVLTRATNVSTTSFRITGVILAADKLAYHCFGYR